MNPSPAAGRRGGAVRRRIRRWYYLDSRRFWDVLYRSGLSSAIGLRYAGIGSIFMFHRVVPDVAAEMQPAMCVSARFLAAWLASLRRAGVALVSLDEAVRRIRDPEPPRRRRRFVAMTFDDGYADNLTHALPVMERFEAPFTVYITTDMVEPDGHLWWLGLAKLFRDRDAVEVAPMGRSFRTETVRRKVAAGVAVGSWVHADGSRAALLNDVFRRYGVSVAAATAEVGLSRGQLAELHRHPLVTIGGHTTTHPHLPGLDDADAIREIRDNREYLEDALDDQIEHFAYPSGACGPREATLVARAGFRTAVTVEQRCLFRTAEERSLMFLPRCTANGSRMWLSFLHAQRHGARYYIENRRPWNRFFR